MTLDYEAKDTKILGKDLKPGDCIREEKGSNDTCVVLSTTFDNKRLKEFYNDDTAFEFFDINSSEYGPCSTYLDIDKEYNLINSRKDILDIYKEIDYALLKQAADIIEYRRKLVKVRACAITKLNNKLKEKEEKEYECL